MKLRSGAVAVVSLAIGLALVGLLLRISGLGLQDITARFAGMDTRACFGLVCFIILNAFLSSEKWRITDRAIRHTSNRELSQFESFTLSALGSALGQILPVQLSMPLARTLGTRIHGRAFNRGTLGSLFEQSFDVFFGCFLMIASVGTYLLHGQWNIWVALAVPCAAIAILSVGTILGLTRRLAGKAVSERANPVGWRKFAIELSNSALLEPALGRKLMFFSALRFVVFVLMAGEITRAIHMAIPLWRLAAAMPFALLSTAAGITPGGLGLAEFTYVGVLAALGTPVALTTQWVLANRLLVTFAYAIVAVVVVPAYFGFRTAGTKQPNYQGYRDEMPEPAAVCDEESEAGLLPTNAVASLVKRPRSTNEV